VASSRITPRSTPGGCAIPANSAACASSAGDDPLTLQLGSLVGADHTTSPPKTQSLHRKPAVTNINQPASETTPAPSNLDPQARALRDEVLRRLANTAGKDNAAASPRDWFIAAALATRDRIVSPWFAATKRTYRQDRRRVYYLSLEFLVGRLLIDALTNLGLTESMRSALADLGIDLDAMRALEPDAALGNGGLGRLAACFMDSMATLEIPAMGYGIRYDHGLFRQTIKDGWQHEYPEDWLSFGNPWEFPRPETLYDIGFGGRESSVGRRHASACLAAGGND
jgi:glucan phosphorylase